MISPFAYFLVGTGTVVLGYLLASLVPPLVRRLNRPQPAVPTTVTAAILWGRLTPQQRAALRTDLPEAAQVAEQIFDRTWNSDMADDG